MNGMENVRRIPVHLPKMVELEDTDDLESDDHPLDSPEAQKELEKISEWFMQAQIAQRDNRAEMAKDEAFYDGEQWDAQDAAELESRGQAPLVFNKIKPTIDWICGTERKARVDQAVYARKKEFTEAAESKSELLKYLSDVNRMPYHRSRAFTDSVIAGIGWLESGACDDGDEQIFDRFESWRNVWYDHLGVELDGSADRFQFRARWVDLDVAQAMFPDRAEQLSHEAINTNQMMPNVWGDLGIIEDLGESGVYGGEAVDLFISGGHSRQRVRLVECWYRKPETCQVMRCADHPFSGAIYRDDEKADPRMSWMVKTGKAQLVPSVKMAVHSLIFCGKTVLQMCYSPYLHNRFPLTPIWCYRRRRDGAPYGMIRNLRSPQVDLNKRHSKALFILSTNQIIADADATDNWKELRAEADRPDGVIRKKKGSDFTINTDRGVAQDHLTMMDRDSKFIQDVSGVTDENMGHDSNAVSGKAVQLRQNQGQTSTAVVFDNYYMAVQISGELRLSLIEQFYDQSKIVRIVGDSGRVEFKDINGESGNITESKADYVVSQQDYRSTMRQAMFDSLMDMLQKMDADVALQILDLVVDMSDIPNREEIVSRIRSINKQRDPKADENDPEVQAEIQTAQQDAQKQKQLVEDAAQAKIDLDKARALDIRNSSVVKAIESLYSALQAAQVAATVPGVVPIADEIAKSGGFVDLNAAPLIPQPLVPAPAVVPVGQNTSPMYPDKPAGPGQGMMTGIETQRLDGIQPTITGGSV